MCVCVCGMPLYSCCLFYSFTIKQVAYISVRTGFVYLSAFPGVDLLCAQAVLRWVSRFLAFCLALVISALCSSYCFDGSMHALGNK